MFELKNVRQRVTLNDGVEFSASIYQDGDQIGKVEQEGRGGGNTYFPHSCHEVLKAHIKTLPLGLTPYDDDPDYVERVDFWIESEIAKLERKEQQLRSAKYRREASSRK